MERTCLGLTTKSKYCLRRKIVSLKAIWLMEDGRGSCKVVKGRCRTNKHN